MNSLIRLFTPIAELQGFQLIPIDIAAYITVIPTEFWKMTKPFIYPD